MGLHLPTTPKEEIFLCTGFLIWHLVMSDRCFVVLIKGDSIQTLFICVFNLFFNKHLCIYLVSVYSKWPVCHGTWSQRTTWRKGSLSSTLGYGVPLRLSGLLVSAFIYWVISWNFVFNFWGNYLFLKLALLSCILSILIVFEIMIFFKNKSLWTSCMVDWIIMWSFGKPPKFRANEFWWIHLSSANSLFHFVYCICSFHLVKYCK